MILTFCILRRNHIQKANFSDSIFFYNNSFICWMTKIEYGIGPGGQYGQTVTYDYGNGCQTKTFTPMSNSPPGEVKYNWDAPYTDHKFDRRVARTIGQQRANKSAACSCRYYYSINGSKS